MENVFLPTVDDADDEGPPAIAVRGAGAVFLLDHMSSDRTRMIRADDYDVLDGYYILYGCDSTIYAS